MTNFSPEVLNPLVLLCGCLLIVAQIMAVDGHSDSPGWRGGRVSAPSSKPLIFIHHSIIETLHLSSRIQIISRIIFIKVRPDSDAVLHMN